jgi:triphosphoribosyl-dephospho-CoA synthase
MMGARRYDENLQRAYLRACELDVATLKPGNVSVFRPGHNMTADDFRVSARVTAPILATASYAVGERIYRAVTATHDAVGCNTNLGILLLAAPLFAAAQRRSAPADLRCRLRATLAGLRVDDADWAYRAIRTAAPAGLGQSSRHDVTERPRVDLRQAMMAAAGRDRIAYQYGHGYPDILDFALPLLRRLLRRWRDPAWAVAGVYLALLARLPDSHIARKHGAGQAEAVRRQAMLLSADLLACAEPQDKRRELHTLDEHMKRHDLNPGTTADLTVATVMAKDFDAIASQWVPRPVKQNCSGGELHRCVST